MSRSSLIGLAFASAFALTILLSARRLRTTERHTFAWLLVCALIAVMAVWRSALDVVAKAMGIYYPPSAIFFAACGLLLWLVYRLSLQVAEQRQQLKRLAQEVALLVQAETERQPGTRPPANDSVKA